MKIPVPKSALTPLLLMRSPASINVTPPVSAVNIVFFSFNLVVVAYLILFDNPTSDTNCTEFTKLIAYIEALLRVQSQDC